MAPRFASFAPFWRLIVDHLECPDIAGRSIADDPGRTDLEWPNPEFGGPRHGPVSEPSLPTHRAAVRSRSADDDEERRPRPPPERRPGRPRRRWQDDACRAAPLPRRRDPAARAR